MYCIYRITNKINNKTYIGQHKYKDLSIDEYMGSGKYICRAIKKHGIENFEREILISEIETKEEVDKLEKRYIKLERESGHSEYNITDGGEGWNLSGKSHPLYGKHHSEFTKMRMSESQKGKHSTPKSDKTKINMSNSHKGVPLSSSHRASLSKARIGNKYRQGKYHSEETKMKMSESHKVDNLSEETRLRMSKSKMGKRYYNNGIECHRYIPGEEPEGYILGMLPRIKS